MDNAYNRIIDKMCADGCIEHHMRIRTELSINEKSFRPGRVRVYLPVPIACRQLREGQILDMDPVPRLVAVETYPQRTAYFEERLDENRSFFIEYAFDNVIDYVCPDYGKACEQQHYNWEDISNAGRSSSCGCHSYLGAEDELSRGDFIQEDNVPLDRDDESFLEALRVSESNPLKRARAVYERITASDKYIGKENLYFVSMCRRAFVAARWQGGLYAGPCPAGLEKEYGSVCPSDWVQYYVSPYRFIFADCRMGRLLRNNDAGLCEFYFTNIDPFRVPLASVYGGRIYPAKEFERADPYINCFGEAEYDDRELRAEEYTTVHTVML